MNSDGIQERVDVGDRVRFDGKATSWLIRAEARNGRYRVATASMFGNVFYTVIDFDEQVRGPLNILGGGMGIFTTSGPDEAIDETVRMLEERVVYEDGSEPEREQDRWAWEVSYRNRVPLHITKHVRAARSSSGEPQP